MDAPVHPLTPDVVVAGDPAGTLGRANAVALLDGDRSVIVDTMLVPSLTAPLRRYLGRWGARPDLVVNTHPHADHVGGNAAFPRARIVAHAATVAMVAELAVQASDPAFLAGLFPAFAGELATTDLVVPAPIDAADLPAGVELLELGPAHSPGDLALWVPAEEVIVCGDVCFNGVTPLALPGHASVTGWAAALDRIAALRPRHVVPGHGPATTGTTIAELREYLDVLLATATEVAAGGLSQQVAVERLTHAPLAGWAEPGRHGLNLRVATAEVAGTGSVHAGAPQFAAAGHGHGRPGDGAPTTASYRPPDLPPRS
jgi:cyclase